MLFTAALKILLVHSYGIIYESVSVIKHFLAIFRLASVSCFVASTIFAGTLDLLVRKSFLMNSDFKNKPYFAELLSLFSSLFVACVGAYECSLPKKGLFPFLLTCRNKAFILAVIIISLPEG